MLATLSKKLLQKLSNKIYRDAYVEENVRTGLAYQIRALREQRGWTQEEFGRLLRAGQSTVSRLEDPDYGKLTVSSLLQVASACNVALLIKFVAFEEMIIRSRDVSLGTLEVPSWDETKFRTNETRVITTRLASVSGEGDPLPENNPIQVVRGPELEVLSL